MTKKIFNKIITLMILVTVFFGIGTVKAASVPSQIKVSSIGKINYGGRYYFPVKYTSDGTLAYCTEFYDQFPMGITMTNPKKVDAGIAYIIANGYKGTKSDYGNDSKMKQYYITQLAIYTYLGQANPAKNNDVHKAVWNLVNKAKSTKENSQQALNVSLSTNSKTMKLTTDGKYFMSEAITVKSNSNKKFDLLLSDKTNAFVVDGNGNKVTQVQNGNVVYVKMPENIIKNGQTITFQMSVKGTRTVQNAYVYTPAESKYQNMVPSITYPETESASDKISLQASKDKIVTEVKISKQDITTKKELEGAKMVLKDSKGETVLSWTSGTSAKIIKGLDAGNYSLCETAAPEGYELYTECINFTVKADGTSSTVIMYNAPKKTPTQVKVSKQDITTKKELEGASLVIKDSNGKEVIAWTSGKTPKTISGLTAGNYTLCETAAPEGYELYTECIKFTVKADGTPSTVIMYNAPKKVTTKVKISKQDITTKKELEGATLVIKNSKGEKVEEWVSTTEVKYIEGLEAGDYTLCETQAPNGYVLATECVKFTVKEDGSTTKVTMYNTPKKEEVKETKLSIIKKDCETKKALAGATLVLKDETGNVVEEWVSTTDAKVFNNLKEGNYTLVETKAPKGYILNTEPIKVNLKANNKTTTVVMYNTPKKEITKLKISKQDIATKEELEGATLVLKNSKGEVVEEWVSTKEAKYFEALSEGKYTLCETKAPDGYVLETECKDFTVKADGSITKVVMYNTKETKEVTKVQISKQDITTKEELEGATLVIKNNNGEKVEEWVSTNEPKYIEGLETGDYTLCETQAPDGYVLATECVKFTVTSDGKVAKVVMYNTKKEQPKSYKTKVFKLDTDTKNAVAGATLVIKNEAGEELYKFVTNDSAAEFELQPGKYTLQEIEAPNGYLLSNEVITFTVSDDETVTTEVTMYNTKAVNVPITASNVSILVYVIGLLGMAYGFKTVFVNARL